MTNLEIETFLTICWHKSISKVSEALYISQSSLSTRLKKLEQEIGCQLLFLPQWRPFTGTDSGRS